ncbi:Uncharacterised protein [Mycobacteroides abscessus subsp. abscessus]|nr:Uncharacterised protein [Mycobacteroides abscessus subsp. abscessus]
MSACAKTIRHERLRTSGELNGSRGVDRLT